MSTGTHYRVRIYAQWLVVPDDAVVTEANRFGPAVVWPYNDRYGNTQIAALCLALARNFERYGHPLICADELCIAQYVALHCSLDL
jgi:hypothetical protein